MITDRKKNKNILPIENDKGRGKWSEVRVWPLGVSSFVCCVVKTKIGSGKFCNICNRYVRCGRCLEGNS